MKLKYISIFALLIMLVSPSFASETESFTVNGLKVIFKQNTATDIVAVRMYLRGGTRVLDEKQAGIENLALAVAQKATENYPKEKLNSALESMDSRISHSVNNDYSSLNLQCVKQNLAKSWKIFADILLHPAFIQQDVELEREKLLSAISQRQDNPDRYLRDLFFQAFFTDHPYAIDEAGTEATISSFTREELKNYLVGRMTTSQLLLVVVGNTSQSDLKQMVTEAFGSLPEGNYQQAALPPVEHPETSMKIVERELPTKYIMGGFNAPSFGSQESYPMMIAMSILRDRLFEEVRTKRSLSYAPSARYASAGASYGYIYVTAVDPDTTIKVMTNELEKLKNQPVTDKELRNKVNVFITRYYLNNETNQSQAGSLARYELLGNGFRQNAEFISNVQKVTPQSIQAVCQKYIDKLQYVLLGNPASLEIRNFVM